jgi:exodeoxyribonuclease VII large subunit
VFYENVWLRAEISELHTNRSGHCYLELIEKGENGTIIAKQRATIWADTFTLLAKYFEDETGQTLKEGLNILVYCSVEMHENYGLSLNITDINPEYTLGDIISAKQKIINMLEAEGIIDMNRQLSFPALPQRIAVISSKTAAGFEDFCTQLQNNEFGYQFHIKLFEATMQGAQTESSVIKAFDNIFAENEHFDIVVIIRGGGAVSDLSAFNNYNIATRVVQFPLPVLCGIGHQRDSSVLDAVSHTSVKTPTAAAEFIISKFYEQNKIIANLGKELTYKTKQIVDLQREKLNKYSYLIPLKATELQKSLHKKNEILFFTMKNAIRRIIASHKSNLELFGKTIELISPQTVMKKGYSYTMKNGEVVKSKTEFAKNDKIKVYFYDGTIAASVEDII